MVWVLLIVSFFLHPALFLGVLGWIIGGPVGAFVGAVAGLVVAR
jgi:hypothetical protein